MQIKVQWKYHEHFSNFKMSNGETRVGVEMPRTLEEHACSTAPCPVRRRVVYVMQWHFLVQYLNLIKCDLLWFHFIWFDLIWCSPSLAVSRLASCRLVEQKQPETQDQMQHRNATSWSVYTYIIRGTSHESRLCDYFFGKPCTLLPVIFFWPEFQLIYSARTYCKRSYLHDICMSTE